MPRWYWGFILWIVSIELVIGLAIKWDAFPTMPDPVFQKPIPVDTFEYHWEAGPWDDDSPNECWSEYDCIEFI